MESDPKINDDEIRGILMEMSYGLANHPGLEFDYLPRMAERMRENYEWCLRNAPQDIPQIFRGMEPSTLEQRLKSLSPRGRKEALERVIKLGGGSRNWRP